MRPFLTAAILVCLSSLQIAGQTIDAEVEIADGGIQLEAPIECEVGELVRLDARNSNVDSVVWDILPKTSDFEVVDLRGFFSARNGGEFLILIAGAKGGKAFLYHQKITVNGECDKSFPPLSDLTLKVKSWVRNLLTDVPARDAKLKALADVFRRLSEGDINVNKILESTALANSAVIGKEDLKEWLPFLDRLGQELDSMGAKGELRTADQYRVAWRAISIGLAESAK